MGRSPCCSKVGLRRGPWSTKEDALLTEFIHHNGEGQWRSLPKKAGLLRCGKSCRLRWMNYLRPGIKRGDISQDEEDLIVRLHSLLGNRWSLIAGRLPGRTDNEIKNYWNTHLVKKLNKPKPPQKHPKIKNNKSNKKLEKPVTDDKKEANRHIGNNQVIDNIPKTKVYSPKPIRVSSAFSRTDSVDSLLSGSSSCVGGRQPEVSVEPMAWAIFELEEDPKYEVGGGGYSFMPLPESDFCNDLIALDQVYDEYLSLL